MPVWPRIWRRALARALFTVTSLTATPAVAACPAATVAELAARLPGSLRFEFGADELAPFLALWDERADAALPGRPDGVALFARRERPLLVAYARGGCLLALLPSPPAELWRALRRHVGPIA